MFLFQMVFLLFFFSSTDALAYLDPGTGSLVIQGIIAGILSAGAIIKLYWYKLKSYFVRSEGNEDENESKNDEN